VVVPSAGDRRLVDNCLTLITSKPMCNNPSDILTAAEIEPVTVSRSVCLGIKLTTRFLLLSNSCEFVDVGRCLWREDGSTFEIDAGLDSVVVLGSESRGTRDHILLSQIRDFPFRRLLRLVRLRWRYSTPPPHRIDCSC
jgi:hypothetical protein